MIDVMQYTKRPTVETIQNYPTVMDIVEYMAELEEQQIKTDTPLGGTLSWMYRLMQLGVFTLVMDENRRMPILVPGARRMMVFYRGQSEEHTPCVPSVWRGKRERWSRNELISQFQTAEMLLILKQHPVIQFVENTPIEFTNSFGQKISVIVPVQYDALAQHYGISTRYLDLTTDKWTAAFFAATDWADGQYTVHYGGENLNSQYGVFYVLDRSSQGVESMTKMGVFPVGMHYFNRPGRQSAYAMCMQRDVPFEQMEGVVPIYFRHDREANEMVFAVSQHSKGYFPEDSFAGVVEQIVNRANQSFTLSMIKLTRAIYHPQWSEEDMMKSVKGAGIDVEEDLCTRFSPKEMKADWEEWSREGKDRYLSKVNFMNIAPMSC